MTKNVIVPLEKKQCSVSLSAAAEAALAKQREPIVAEIVVTLACCVKKVVKFRPYQSADDLPFVVPNLALKLVSAEHEAQEVAGGGSLPAIANWNALAPRWINIDFQKGEWVGDFGYTGTK